MLIHSTNVTGLGASQVVSSFIDAACKLNLLDKSIVFLPNKGHLLNYVPSKGKVYRYRRFLPNGISRILEIYFAKYLFSEHPVFLVLGDIPLRRIKNQVVLVHQPNLIYPRVNLLSAKSLKFRVLRSLFRSNLKYASRVIVQTDVMKKELLLSYPGLAKRIEVVPQPIPSWFKYSNISKSEKRTNQTLKLFYPAAGYNHKNHMFLKEFNDYLIQNGIEIPNIEVWLTLTAEEFVPFEKLSFVKNLGRLNHDDVMSAYQECDSLLFLSLVESYGLPLIESLSISLPILTIDLPYARWMCEDSVYYFSPNSFSSFLERLEELNEDLCKGINPNYMTALSKFPKSWEEVVKNFLELV